MRKFGLVCLMFLAGCQAPRKESSMSLGCSHIVFNVSDLRQSRDFYLGKLGMEPLQDGEGMFAFRAGEVRVSVFGGGKRLEEKDPVNMVLVLKTEAGNLDPLVKSLKAKGVEFDGEVQDAPGFMRFIPLHDPDNNPLMLGEYAADPLKPSR